MEYLPMIFSAVLVVLVIILSIVGIYLVLVLMEVKRTLQKVNQTLDLAEDRLNAIAQPLHRLGGMAAGLGTGFKVFEAFVGWLNRHKEKE